MKCSAILILLCATALPASAVAQDADTPLVETKWSLKPPPRKKAPPKILPKAMPKPNRMAANVEGPAVPAAQRPVKVKAKRKAPPPRAKRDRLDPAAIVAVAKHGQRQN